MKKYLIVNADDFGLHPNINKGIELAAEQGIVTSISFITNTPYFAESLTIAKRHPEISVGVHLNLTDGQPLFSSDNLRFLLNKKGEFFGSHSRVIYAIISHPIRLRQIRDEFTRQIKKLLANQINISHLDSHGHIHLLPSLFNIVSELAEEFHIPFVRIPREKLSLRDYFSRWPLPGINLLAKHGIHHLTNSQVRHPDHFFGLKDAGKFTKKRLIKIIKQLDNGITEIAVHPGNDNRMLAKKFDWGYAWNEELLALTDKEVRDEICRRQIDLTNFSRI